MQAPPLTPSKSFDNVATRAIAAVTIASTLVSARNLIASRWSRDTNTNGLVGPFSSPHHYLSKSKRPFKSLMVLGVDASGTAPPNAPPYFGTAVAPQIEVFRPAVSALSLLMTTLYEVSQCSWEEERYGSAADSNPHANAARIVSSHTATTTAPIATTTTTTVSVAKLLFEVPEVADLLDEGFAVHSILVAYLRAVENKLLCTTAITADGVRLQEEQQRRARGRSNAANAVVADGAPTIHMELSPAAIADELAMLRVLSVEAALYYVVRLRGVVGAYSKAACGACARAAEALYALKFAKEVALSPPVAEGGDGTAAAAGSSSPNNNSSSSALHRKDCNDLLQGVARRAVDAQGWGYQHMLSAYLLSPVPQQSAYNGAVMSLSLRTGVGRAVTLADKDQCWEANHRLVKEVGLRHSIECVRKEVLKLFPEFEDAAEIMCFDKFSERLIANNA